MKPDVAGNVVELPAQRRGNWIETFSGWRFWPLDPWPSSVSIVDISHSLAHQCRFAGHVRVFYSVAQHSVHVSELVPPKLALEGLLHDAAEAYLVDLPRPIKVLPEMAAYREAERRVMQSIERRFRLASCSHPEVRRADEAMLVAEARALMRPMVPDWTAEIGEPAANIEITPWPAKEARHRFLQRFDELWGKR